MSSGSRGARTRPPLGRDRTDAAGDSAASGPSCWAAPRPRASGSPSRVRMAARGGRRVGRRAARPRAGRGRRARAATRSPARAVVVLVDRRASTVARDRAEDARRGRSRRASTRSPLGSRGAAGAHLGERGGVGRARGRRAAKRRRRYSPRAVVGEQRVHRRRSRRAPTPPRSASPRARSDGSWRDADHDPDDERGRGERQQRREPAHAVGCAGVGAPRAADRRGATGGVGCVAPVGAILTAGDRRR